jgi:glycosyltransferase involved in cell wall biosynthesis
VDTNYFTPFSPSECRSDITFIGRLDYLKGVHILFEALIKLKADGIAVNLTIIGDGPDRDRLTILARDKNILNSIRFCGEVENILPYMQKSALFVLPSLSEGLSNVLLESMACGLPVIATRVGGNPDVIQDNVNGILVEPEHPDHLHQALKKVLLDKALAEQLGREARKTVEEKFSLQAVTDQYLSLYQELSGI